MLQALLLLQSALALLTFISNPHVKVTDEFRAQIDTIANQAIETALKEINQTPTTQTTVVYSTPEISQPIGTAPLPIETPKQMTTIEIINPYPSKGLGRKYKASPEIVDEKNYIEIGLVIYGDDESVLNTPQVTIEATDSTQNKTLNGTGNVTKVYKNGNERTVSYYPFHYEFKQSGEHTITFTTDGVSKSATVTVE